MKDYTGTSCLLPAGCILLLLATHISAFSSPYTGTLIDGEFTLIHEGAATPTNDANDWLRFLPDLSFNFDVSATMITAGTQTYDLASDNGATATFTLLSLAIVLGGATGLSGGSLEYLLDGVSGTFIFADETYSGSWYNSVVYAGDTVSFYLWGADSVNGLGIDLGATGLPAPIPIPGALVLLSSALLGLRRLSGA